MLISYSLLPQAPPLTKECLFKANPPLGAESLNGHKNLLASLKAGPHVESSCNKSSTQTIPFLPKPISTTSLEVIGTLYLFNVA